eukprot:scaffold323_cov363-Pavlova_lutheri.AAC.4
MEHPETREGTATKPPEQKIDWNGPRFRLAHQETAVEIQARDLPAPFQPFPSTRGHQVRITSLHHMATIHDATVADRSRKAGTASLETHAPSECCGWLEEPPPSPCYSVTGRTCQEYPKVHGRHDPRPQNVRMDPVSPSRQFCGNQSTIQVRPGLPLAP